MKNFCTLFDSAYLTRGLALYSSLEEHCKQFHIYIFAFDDSSYSYLKNANLDKATVISLKEFEDDQLLQVKNSRTKAEYCWTCTPSIILYSLTQFNLESCTYLDADLYFFSPVEKIFDEFGDNSILLTEHRYSKLDIQEKIRGKYCVQFMTFLANKNGMEALNWWRDRCIEWCFSRYEDGKFGDQLYLDDWLERFRSVYVLQNEGAGVAPWNMESYDFSFQDNSTFLTKRSNNKTMELVFFHYHHLELFTNNKVTLSYYKTDKNLKEFVYKPYIMKLLDIEDKVLNSSNYQKDDLRKTEESRSVMGMIRKLKHFYNGTLNEFNTLNFLK